MLSDAEILGINVDKYRTTIHTPDGQRFEFVVEGDHDTITKHHREIVERTGFGPEGLANMIYSDACAFAKEQSVPNNRVRIRLSEEALNRVGKAVEKWTHYKFLFGVQPALSGITYTFEIIADE